MPVRLANLNIDKCGPQAVQFLVSARSVMLQKFIATTWIDRLSRFHNMPLSRGLGAADRDPAARSTRQRQYVAGSAPR